jgi:hypothetical protein
VNIVTPYEIIGAQHAESGSHIHLVEVSFLFYHFLDDFDDILGNIYFQFAGRRVIDQGCKQ